MKSVLLSALALLICICSYAQPQKFNYQGVARYATGAAIGNQNIGLRITILGGSLTGTPLYVETHQATTNQFGLYNVAIGGGSATMGTMSGINWGNGDKYVKVEIDPAGGTAYTDMGAAQLLSVPYALYAGSGGLNGTTNNLLKFTSPTTAGNSNVVETGTGVGVGTTTPSAKLHVSGSSDVNYTLGGQTFNHNAIVAQTTGTGTSNVSRGVVANAGNSNLENHGVFGLASGAGASNNVGIFGSATPSSTTSGISVGVLGIGSGGADNVGVFGNANTGDLAGYFNGTVNVNGSLAKAAGTFKIDHPLDPANKYLYHSFVESPDMMNVYNGNISTDANGVATVQLPDYFEALNKDFRYQLTVIGTFAQAIVAEKVNGNKFVIKTNQPNVEVSWQVTGIRNDKYAEAHRVVPEVEKEPKYKGFYLHAAEYDQPETKSINYLMLPASARELMKQGDVK